MLEGLNGSDDSTGDDTWKSEWKYFASLLLLSLSRFYCICIRFQAY